MPEHAPLKLFRFVASHNDSHRRPAASPKLRNTTLLLHEDYRFSALGLGYSIA